MENRRKAMKFVHIADLHLGKAIHQCSLLHIQKELLWQLLDQMKQQDIHLLIIAGDVYDRFIPSQEAVSLLDDFLTTAILEYHIQILMISGNHDSSDRLHFASSLLAQNGLHIETHIQKDMQYVEIDHTRFYLLPFLKPSHIRMLYPDENIYDYQSAFEIYMKNQHIDKNYQNILITHQFVGKSSITCESEIPLSVGGSEIIDASLFQDFDYVALGHLHSPQKVTRETIRYSGSLMCYSFDEVKQKKSYVVVDTDDMSIDLQTLTPSQTLRVYQGTFKEFMNPDYIEKKDDFLSFELDETTLIPHAIEQLRVLYPNLLQITYPKLIQQSQTISHSIEAIETMDQYELFKKFYHDMKGTSLDPKQETIIQELLEKVGENQ